MRILFWAVTSRANRHGLTPISMRLTIEGRRVELKTNISVEPNSWDKDGQRIKGNAPLIQEYNKTLMALATSAWNHYNDALRRGNSITPEAIRELVLNRNKPFIDYWKCLLSI